ncbi:hypothetical protein, partial [Calothrix sp. CCY 0018]|uniref:hypothetical protein n=1 Tax=Calothrix sp. CCY 0018 TaxID=3103864 RepID=UPI0039C67C06
MIGSSNLLEIKQELLLLIAEIYFYNVILYCVLNVAASVLEKLLRLELFRSSTSFVVMAPSTL